MMIVFVYKSVILQRCLSLASGMSQTNTYPKSDEMDLCAWLNVSSIDSMSELEPVQHPLMTIPGQCQGPAPGLTQ